MLTAILGVTTVICAVGWFFSRVSFKTIIFCWKERGYPPPTDEDIHVNTRKVLEKIFSFGAKTSWMVMTCKKLPSLSIRGAQNMKWLRKFMYRAKRRVFLLCKPQDLTVYLFQGVEKVGMTGLYDPEESCGWGTVKVEWASAEMCMIQIRPPVYR